MVSEDKKKRLRAIEQAIFSTWYFFIQFGRLSHWPLNSIFILRGPFTERKHYLQILFLLWEVCLKISLSPVFLFCSFHIPDEPDNPLALAVNWCRTLNSVIYFSGKNGKSHVLPKICLLQGFSLTTLSSQLNRL